MHPKGGVGRKIVIRTFGKLCNGCLIGYPLYRFNLCVMV